MYPDAFFLFRMLHYFFTYKILCSLITWLLAILGQKLLYYGIV